MQNRPGNTRPVFFAPVGCGTISPRWRLALALALALRILLIAVLGRLLLWRRLALTLPLGRASRWLAALLLRRSLRTRGGRLLLWRLRLARRRLLDRSTLDWWLCRRRSRLRLDLTRGLLLGRRIALRRRYETRPAVGRWWRRHWGLGCWRLRCRRRHKARPSGRRRGRGRSLRLPCGRRNETWPPRGWRAVGAWLRRGIGGPGWRHEGAAGRDRRGRACRMRG